MKDKSREYTVEEVRKQFLDHVRYMVGYWEGIPKKSSKDKLEGLAFSIMVLLDGGACAVPCGFLVAPDPHPTDKTYHVENQKNWYPENSSVKCNIAGGLHEELWRPQ